MGQWKNFAELEENISLPELKMILQAKRDKEHADRRFAASLKGIDLDEASGGEPVDFEEVEMKAKARLTGLSEHQVELMDVGMGYEMEE